MEVPFISSGAMSRAHYALVQKLEYATSTQSANQHLMAQVESIRGQLANSTLSLEECKKCLIILLYCYMNVLDVYSQPNTFHFALPHAITLAEAGRNIGQKRIGYLFCAEVMPIHHELQLMLVNTLRKDLERDDVPSICLALENVIAYSKEDLVPAIQSRLQDLLSHNSSHIRRRALLAFRSLAPQHPELLAQIHPEVVRSLRDPHPSVSNAAFALSIHFVKNKELAPTLRSAMNEILEKNLMSSQPSSTVRLLFTLFHVGLSDTNTTKIVEIIQSTSDRVVLRGAFQLLSRTTSETLLTCISKESGSPVQHIRHFLTSHDPNDVHLFLSCLECVDPILWGGTTPDFPAVLDGWEVERIMQFLDSPDALIRKTTLKLLNRIDPNIVSSYYSRVVEDVTPSLSVRDVDEFATRLVGVVDIQCGVDGELYARELKDLLVRLEQHFPRLVMERVVTTVLHHWGQAGTSFRIGFSTMILGFLIASRSSLPQTMMVIAAALATEQCGQLSISPLDVIQGFSSKLSSCAPSVQDACLVAMLRIAAECQPVPPLVVETVTELGKVSKRHIRRRCEQFVSIVNDKTTLAEVVGRAKSTSLPDFVTALLEQRTKVNRERSDNRLHSETMSEGGSSLSRVESSNDMSKSMTTLVTFSGGSTTEEVGSRVDLISLDSPFVEGEVDFEQSWDEFDKWDIRGWYSGSVECLVRVLEGSGYARLRVISVDVPPFVGETKVVLGERGILRLKETDEESCMWRMRSSDEGLSARVKGLLT